jgi:hypothetical protein
LTPGCRVVLGQAGILLPFLGQLQSIIFFVFVIVAQAK